MKFEDLPKCERAIIALAKAVEAMNGCDVNALKVVLHELELELKPKKP